MKEYIALDNYIQSNIEIRRKYWFFLNPILFI